MDKYLDTQNTGRGSVTNDIKFLVKPLNTKKQDLAHWYDGTVLHKDGKWVATDGHRMHMVNDLDMPLMEDGLYDLIIKTNGRVALRYADDQERRYPDYERVIPMGEVKETLSVGPLGISQGYTHTVRKMEENWTLDMRYFTDVAECDDFKITIFKDDFPVMFENGTKTALIMPMRI